MILQGEFLLDVRPVVILKLILKNIFRSKFALIKFMLLSYFTFLRASLQMSFL